MVKRCSKCRGMIKGGEFSLPNYTGILCRECYDNTFICSVCGKKSDRIILKSTGVSICGDCEKRTGLVCCNCGTPVRSENLDEDSIPVCNPCKKKGISDPKELYNVSSFAYRFMEKYFDYDFRSVPLKMADPDEIRVRTDSTQGFARHTSVAGRPGSSEIAVMRYTPKDKARYFLIHELTHCWQYSRNLIADDNRKISEGFAVWMETRYAFSIDDKDYIKKCLRNPDSIYGGGFRLFYDLERKLGAEFIIANAEKFHRAEQLINLTRS